MTTPFAPKTRTGIPRDFTDVRRAVEELGFALKRVTGGHYIFKNEAPVKTWEQSATVCIPSVIKAPKTLRSILNGAGYFKAHNLKPDGSPIPMQTAGATVDGQSIVNNRRSQAFYAWQKAVKQSLRSGSSEIPRREQFEKPRPPH